MSYPKGRRKKIKLNKDYIPQGILYWDSWDTLTCSPISPTTELAKALAANYANHIAAQLVSAQPMDISVEDLAITWAMIDQMKKNRENS